ncbi:GntR family transcriptional regulator [Paenibacillus frigoriresistens]|uniref:LacI family DNA-binding transcriptional regulator n=1 Tax=Paenibacillus alginolyticus TaxID=59839 RepID=UPI001565BB89|nr:GntR family transcriptional regulator [Paenibacillus frigoriresistens]NRF93079.1 GntR family transcriptional regulator [Paenibacillus frigoriresistens]
METHLYKQLYTHIVHEIQQGKLKTGDRVSSEKELAEQFGVSRITSKKALERLAEAGVIKRIQGKGSFVANGHTSSLEQMRQSEERTSAVIRAQERPLIGLIIPSFSDEYGLKLLHSMEKQSALHGCDLIIKRTGGSKEEEEHAIQLFVSLGVKGLIVTPVHGTHYNAELIRLVWGKFPVVLVDRYLKGIPVCSVYTDNRKAAEDLTLHLIGKGHQNIGYLSPPVENTSALEDRLLGYTLAFAREGLKLDQDYCLTNITGTRSGSWAEDLETLKSFLEQNTHVKAFVVSEYLVATMLALAIDAQGKRLETYDIVCFDSLNDFLGKPIFTHIQQDEKRMGEEAVDLLISQLYGEVVTEQRIVEHRMIVKE